MLLCYVVVTGRMNLDDWQDDDTTPKKGSSFSSPISSAKKQFGEIALGGTPTTPPGGASSVPLSLTVAVPAVAVDTPPRGEGLQSEGVEITTKGTGETPTAGDVSVGDISIGDISVGDISVGGMSTGGASTGGTPSRPGDSVGGSAGARERLKQVRYNSFSFNTR